MTLAEALAWLKRNGTASTIAGMARYGIQAKRAFGVPMKTLLAQSKRLGKDHALAMALWDSGWYEARLLASLVDDPALVTKRQMNAWAASFENWGDTDTVCFCLFDKSPFAWDLAPKWAASPREFVKRGGYVLMACLALHDKTAPDAQFTPFFSLMKRGATDERNFVKKGVSWALRAIGRRNLALHAPALKLAKELAESADPSSRWVGKDALRELASAKVHAQLVKKAAKRPKT